MFFRSYLQNRFLIQKSLKRVFPRSSSTHEVPFISPKLTQSYYYNSSSVPLLYHSIGQHLDLLAESHPNHQCYIFKGEGNKKYTYKSFVDEVNSIATSLIDLGFEKGDRIGVWLPNTSESSVLTYAASKVGVIKVNINPAYMERELLYCLNKAGCKGLVLRPNVKAIDSIKILNRLIPELGQTKGQLKSKAVPSLKHVILTAGDYNKGTNTNTSIPSGMLSYTDLVRKGANSNQEQRQKCQTLVDGDTPLAIFYTSGTTGQPKAATLTNYTLLNGSFPVHFTHPNFLKRTCCPVPMFHIFGELGGTLNINVPGYTAHFPAILPDPLATMQMIDEEKSTALIGPPIIFRDLLTHPKRKEFDLSSLQFGMIGATPVNRLLMEEIEREIPIKMMSQVYGQTENSGALTMSVFAGDDKERRYLSIGKPLPRIEAKIVDSNERVVSIGEEGEIYVRGYNLMKGYFGDEEKTRETITTDRWLKTGDLGRMDEDGYIYYRSRRKEMVIVGGLNIYPVEVENLLLEHPKIAEAQVFGIPDKRHGEVLCAWIKLKAGETIDDIENVRKFLSSKISFYKVPKHLKIVDSFVHFLTPSGKVQKFKLTEAMIKEL